MADQQHFSLLFEGDIDTWNVWRTEHPEISPNLSGADLNGADLYRANLSGANLQEANLSGTSLREANLSGADLQEADLNGADLEGVDLVEADLRGANLQEADLNGANLSRAFLDQATLREACLSKANLSGACLSKADLSRADLSRADLSRAIFTQADLHGAYLNKTNLWETNLSRADLGEADLSGGVNLCKSDLSGANLGLARLSGADLREANLSGAYLWKANLSGTDLTQTNLSKANLSGAYLERATLVETNLQKAILTNCSIYGISAWNVKSEEAEQKDLIITTISEPTITVDDIEVAQFIYLMLKNQKIRSVINTITSKAVLILGRFTPERKIILDKIREALRCQSYLPILFDFEKPSSRDLTETVSTLAHLARFIIVDLTDPSSAPHEVATIIPHCVVPVQPLLLLGKNRHEYAMFQDLRRRYDWVLPTYHYTDVHGLLAALQENIIAPAEEKAKELERKA
ncbi:MAG TPA: pentapeptide repeat-containing protein [Ktedonobacteraceae bacterium]|nr:pentapeptide repeat-containing protein [Ktedonobacteraceae bacterium]